MHVMHKVSWQPNGDAQQMFLPVEYNCIMAAMFSILWLLFLDVVLQGIQGGYVGSSVVSLEPSTFSIKCVNAGPPSLSVSVIQ